MWDECYQIGYIVKTHGLKGELIVQLDVDDPDDYTELESVFLEQKGSLIPFFMSGFSLKGTRAIARFKGIDSIDEAKELIGSKLFLPLNQLPKLPEGRYYYHDLVGLDVFENDQKIGTITAIYQPSSQHLASVEIKDKEVLIPIEDDIFTLVDFKTNRANVNLPDGLLDIYLNE
jgi:16S rRNA processing protein RimM